MTRNQAESGGADQAQITKLLAAWSGGDQGALEQLMPIVYDELRRLARRQMRRERSGHPLQTTALINEAYLRLVDLRRMRWQDRAHFFAMSGRLMRRVLVEFARSQRVLKRGGGQLLVAFDEEIVVRNDRAPDLVALDDALSALAALDPRKSQVIEMRFFAGLTVDETAEALHVSRETVMRDWSFAKAWLLREIDRKPVTARRREA